MNDAHDYYRAVAQAANDALTFVDGEDMSRLCDDLAGELSEAAHYAIARSIWHTNTESALRALSYTHNRGALYESTTPDSFADADALLRALAYHAMHADVVERAHSIGGAL